MFYAQSKKLKNSNLTAGQLKKLLENIPDDTEISVYVDLELEKDDFNENCNYVEGYFAPKFSEYCKQDNYAVLELEAMLDW